MIKKLSRWRLKSLSAGLIAVSLGLAGEGIAGANQFGLRYYSFATYGNISSIEVPSSSEQPANANAFYAHRSLEANSDYTITSQIQVGWATVGSNESLECGTTDSQTESFVETDISGTYSCTFVGVGTYPDDYNFNVFDNGSGWQDKINGSPDPNGPYHLGFTEGYGAVGGESDVASGAAKSRTCYGDGPSQWDYYNALNSGGSGALLVTPNVDTQTVLTGGWSIGNAPTPLCDSIGE